MKSHAHTLRLQVDPSAMGGITDKMLGFMTINGYTLLSSGWIIKAQLQQQHTSADIASFGQRVMYGAVAAKPPTPVSSLTYSKNHISTQRLASLLWLHEAQSEV